MDWQPNGIRHGLAKLDYKLLHNVLDIRQSHKVHRENHENLASWIDRRREMLRWSKDPERYISGGCLITISICKSDDATQPHTQKIHRRKKISKSQEKMNHLMFMDNIKLFAKNETELKTLIHTVRTYSYDIEMEFSTEKSALLIKKAKNNTWVKEWTYQTKKN